MKSRSVTLSLLTATLFAIPALAADPAPQDAPPPGPGAGPRGAWREELVKRFDADKDGKLSDAEKAEARKARGEMRQKWAEHGAKMREEMKQKFDTNQDGQLDDGERRAARQAMQDKWAQAGGPRGFHGPRGHGGGEPPMWMRRELHRWFEQQWGGPGGARAGLHHRGPGGPRGHMRAALVKRFDADKDGRLDETERAAAKQAGQEHRARMKENRKQVLERFDTDGDGKLGDSERQNMRDAWQKFLQQQPALKKPAN